MTKTTAPDYLFHVDAYPIVRLSPERDLAAVQALYLRCADFIELTTGAPPTGEEAREVFFNLPRNRTLDDKLVMGCRDVESGALIAVLEMIRGYPSETDYWIGLFLLDPARRRQGLGTRFLHAYQQWAHRQGAQRLQLLVVTQNNAGQAFWQSLGFQEISRTQQVHGRLQYEVIVLEKGGLADITAGQ